MKRLLNFHIITIAIIALIPNFLLAGWHADFLPNYTEDVETWWDEHPFNPESVNYDDNIPLPTGYTTVDLSAGGSIQSAIDAYSGTGGLKIILGNHTYGNFQIVGKNDIHIIAPNDNASVNAGSEKFIAPCTEALDYHNFNACVFARNPSCINCFRNPIKNIYVKGITFNGNGGRSSHTLKVVRGVVFKNCTWTGFGYVGAHHPGLIQGHEKIENTWFINCYFVGTQYNGFYIDGSHAGGCVNCVFESGCSHGMLYLTNDDFSEDFNDNGLWGPNEKRNPQYNCIVGNTFNNISGNCIDINQGGNNLIKDNVQNGSSAKFIYSTDRCSQRYHNLFYEGFGNRVLDNTINDVDYFYEVNSRHENCIQSGQCWNYGRLGRYQVRGNNVNCTNFMYAHGVEVEEPTFVENNAVNGTGSAVTNFTNQSPTISITSPADTQDLTVASDVDITVNVSDPDGSVVDVLFKVNDVIIGSDDTAPFSIVWSYGDVVLGDYKISAIATDNHGKTAYDEINVQVVDNSDSDVQSPTNLPLFVKGTPVVTQNATVNIDLTGAVTANLNLGLFDVDEADEAQMLINGTLCDLPCYAIENAGPHSDSMPIPLSWLNDGQNTFTFRFVDNLGGTTTGYEVHLLELAVAYSGSRTTPVIITPEEGAYSCSVDVTMTCDTNDAEIRYTTDGSEPNQTTGLIYTAPVNLTADSTIRAKAYSASLDPSIETSALYNVANPLNPDIDGSGIVDIGDVAIISEQWLTTAGNAELTCDSQINFDDYSLVALNYQPGVEENTFMQDSGAQGLVIMEAEDYSSKEARDGHNWTFGSDSVTWPGFSGEGYMESTPNDGSQYNTNYETESPVMNFRIVFVHTGTHYIWILGNAPGGSDDSIHLGLDGSAALGVDRFDINEEETGWGWSNQDMDAQVATVDITTTGEHTINIWVREDGSLVDKIILTTDSAYTP